MPVQMRRQIAETGDIHFLRPQRFTQYGFESENRFHENLPIRDTEVGELFDMFIPHNPAKTAIGVAISSSYANQAPFFPANNKFTAVTFAKPATGMMHVQ